MFTYLHAVVYHDFSRSEIDVTDAPTTEAMRRAINAFGTPPAPSTSTRTNADTLREALYAGSGPGAAPLPARPDPEGPGHPGPVPPHHLQGPGVGRRRARRALRQLPGRLPGQQRHLLPRTLVARNTTYRNAFKEFAGYTHLKGTANEWVVRDALGEYGRFGQIEALKTETVSDLGALLPVTTRNFGEGSQPWAKVAGWLNFYEACKPYGVCKDDIERRIFPYTYFYDNGAIKVRTGLDRATVDQLYYASKQVKAQFHRVLGTDAPLAGDTNTSLNIVLYASRADYETYHPLLTGMGTNNGGVYIERGATFYTYQRRVPQDSSLTLEELFRHEYTHYLNGRWAVPGYFGEGPWYQGDRTTAMDEGTAEFFDGATRDDGIAVRKSLVQGVIEDTAGGGPRMTVKQLLHATYDGDGFRFYDYAGTFFEFLWTERPSLIREMYGYLRADDPAASTPGATAWAGTPRCSARTTASWTHRSPRWTSSSCRTPRSIRTTGCGTPRRKRSESSFATATQLSPTCATAPDPTMRRFVCTGRITANLTDSSSPDRIFKDMSETVDYFILDRARPRPPTWPT